MLTVATAYGKDTRSGMCPMQHRHFAAIATVIREGGFGTHRDTIAREFAARLRNANPAFDRERFLKACGVTD